VRAVVYALVAPLALFLAPVSASAGEVVKVSINDLAFAPAGLTVRVGDTVVWTNGDFVDHTATARNGDWDIMIPAGQAGSTTMGHVGTIDYYCRFHPGMTGTINVVAAKR
jgi:plastocyanin